jgi:hypothetical protein
MGLHWDATVTLPKRDNLDEEVKQPLNQGAILATLVAKELKSYYGKGTEEENQAIARYLKEEYDFDVTHKPIAYTPAASMVESSSDEMQQAMMANTTGKQVKYASRRKKAVREGSASPRIRFRRGETIGKSGNTVQQYPRRVKKEWGTYDIGGCSES